MIHLELHLTDTEKALKKHVQEWNAKRRDELDAENKTRLENGEKEISFKSVSVKGTHINTAKMLFRALYKHLLTMADGKFAEPTPFRTNNHAIATMCCTSPATAWRHICKLTECGVIQFKVFHGSNASYELHFNPEILVAVKNYDFIDALLKSAKKLLKTDILPQAVHEKIMQKMPSFGEAPLGMISFCDDIAFGTLQELNVNMEEGAFGNFSTDNVSSRNAIRQELLQEQESITLENVLNTDVNKQPETAQQTRGNENGAPPPQKCSPREIKELLQFHVDMAWDIAHNALYERKYIKDDDVIAAKKFIEQYFLPTSQQENPRFAEMFNRFAVRILLARRWVKKSPVRFIPNPSLYFDPYFEHGFRGTKQWFVAHQEAQKKNKDWNSNLKLFSIIYQVFKKEPTYENYRKGTQRLAKLKDKRLGELFQKCVINDENYSSIQIQEYYAA